MGFDPEHYRIVKEASDKGERVVLPHAQLARVELEDVNLDEADLRGADLSDAILIGARLRNANLSRANLSGSIHQGVFLGKANLSKADLSQALLNSVAFDQADLSGANLTTTSLLYASLNGADLSGAYLLGASFMNTVVENAVFSGAKFQNTIIDFTDMSTTLGLEQSEHMGPSTIGFEAIVQSKGNIPLAFLRGCGLSEKIIQYIPSLVESNVIDFYSCFISYSHEDKSFAQRLHNDLQAKGIRCWLDEHEMKLGDDIYYKVDQGIKKTERTILCASAHSLNSKWVNDEVENALDQEQLHETRTGKRSLRIIPLDLDGYMFKWDGTHSHKLRKRLAGDFVDWNKDNDKYEREFNRLIDALAKDAEEAKEDD